MSSDVPRGPGVMVGRDQMLELLGSAMDSAESAKGSFHILEGEAGIGKTTLTRRAQAMASERSWAVMHGECLFGEGGEPYFPIVRAIRGHLKRLEGEKEERDGDDSLPMGLMGLRGVQHIEERARTKNEFTMERDKMFVNVSEFLSQESEASPVLFVIDDLHWADNATLQLLYYLVRTLKKNRVLFLGAYRPEDVKGTKTVHPILDLKNRLVREGLVETHGLGRFERDQTSELVRFLLGEDATPELIKRIHAQTDGNPFFIMEFVESIKETVEGEGRTESGMSIPSTVSYVITDRINRLEEADKKVLDFGAVIGQEFRYELLLGALDMDEEQLVHSLDRLMEHKIIEESGEASDVIFRFNHNLIREVTYNHLSRSRRRLMHKRIGQCIEEAFLGRTSRAAFQLAYHYSRTADQAKALKYNILSGKEAFRAFALEEAKGYLETALDIILKLEDHDNAQDFEIEVLGMLGEISMITGDWRKALTYHQEALALCDELTEKKAKVYRDIGEVEMNRYEWEQATKALEKSVAISREIGYTRGLAEAYRCLAWIAQETGDHEKALDYGDRTIKQAEKIKDTHLVGKALIDIGNSFNVQNDFDTALSYYSKALERLDPDQDLDQVARAYNNFGDVNLKLGRYDVAIEYFERCLALQKVTGDLILKGFAVANIGESLVKKGDLEKARPYVEEATRILEKVDNKFMIGIMMIMMSKIVKADGDMDAAEGMLMEAISLNEDHNVPVGLAQSYLEYGLFLKEKGDKEGARTQLGKALDQYKQLGSKMSVEKVEEELRGL